MNRPFAGVLAALTMALVASGASAAERALALEVVLNGRPTGRIGEFLDRDGVLYARPSELRDLGFALTPPATDAPIALSTLPNFHAEVDEARQTLVVMANDAALRPSELGGATSSRLAPLTVSGIGAVLNYDILATHSGGQTTVGALLDARVFGPYGVLQGTGLVNATPYVDQKSFVRLDTAYTYTEPDQMRRWRVGDVVTGALSWSRAVRLGGAQVSSDFNLRPDLVTYPLPTISSSAAVPSSVNVMVNGIRQYSQSVQPGPFMVRTLPVVTGAGEVAVAVEDALGRQTLLTLPFYASTALLKPGLASYSFEVGAVRRNYGLATDGYSGWAMNGSLRYGLLNWLTLETHGEATNALAVVSSGAAVRLGTLGVVNAAVSASSGRGGIWPPIASPNNGGFVSLGFQRLSRGLNINLSGTLASDGYRDLAAVNGAPVPSSTLNASIGYQLGDYGTLGVGYISQRSKSPSAGSSLSGLSYGSFSGTKTDLVTASYSVPIAKRFSLHVTGFKDLRQSQNYSLGIGVSFLLGPSTSVSTAGSLDNGRSSISVDVAKPALKQDDFGYQIHDTEGAGAHRLAEGEFLSRWGRVTAGVDQSSDLTAVRAGARGAIVWAGGGLFASNQIYDSFAIVRTGDIANVPVLYENRLVGATDSNGKLLVPSLLSYQNNKLSVDSTRLPPDIEVGQTAILLRPPDRSGVVVEFQVNRVRAALLKLRDRKGQPIPIGSVARIPGGQDRPVGYDGEAYVTGLAATNKLDVVLPDGTRCMAWFDYQPEKADIPVIGPLLCQ